jgi:hypothetical protein
MQRRDLTTTALHFAFSIRRLDKLIAQSQESIAYRQPADKRSDSSSPRTPVAVNRRYTHNSNRELALEVASVCQRFIN